MVLHHSHLAAGGNISIHIGDIRVTAGVEGQRIKSSPCGGKVRAAHRHPSRSTGSSVFHDHRLVGNRRIFVRNVGVAVGGTEGQGGIESVNIRGEARASHVRPTASA